VSKGLLEFLANLNGTISSILAAIIAFIFAARTSLRGRGLDEIEKFYDKAVTGLFEKKAVGSALDTGQLTNAGTAI